MRDLGSKRIMFAEFGHSPRRDRAFVRKGTARANCICKRLVTLTDEVR